MQFIFVTKSRFFIIALVFNREYINQQMLIASLQNNGMEFEFFVYILWFCTLCRWPYLIHLQHDGNVKTQFAYIWRLTAEKHTKKTAHTKIRRWTVNIQLILNGFWCYFIILCCELTPFYLHRRRIFCRCPCVCAYEWVSSCSDFMLPGTIWFFVAMIFCPKKARNRFFVLSKHANEMKRERRSHHC